MGKENSAQIGSSTKTTSKIMVLITSSVALFTMSFMASSLNLALPTISHEFNADAIIVSWIVTVYLLDTAVFSVPFSRIANIVGVKKIFILGMMVFVASMISVYFSNSSIMLLLSRIAQGIGGAMIVSTSMALVPAVYPDKERGMALGINIAFVYTGSSLGPFAGGILTQYFGWRSIFLVGIILSLITIFLIFWKIKGEWCTCKGEKFDYRGSIVYGLALVVLMYGFSILPELLGIILVVIGILGLAFFYHLETRTHFPVLDVSILRINRAFSFSSLAAMISYTAISSITFLLSLYLQYIKALTPEKAGFIMLTQPVMQALLSPFTGRLSDRIEPRIVASIGMALTCLGLLSFAFLNNSTSLILIIITLAVYGIGFALFSSPNVNAIMSSVPPKQYVLASAISQTGRSIGQMLGMGITMIVIAIMIGPVVITPDYYPAFVTSTRIAFGILTLLCFGGIFVSLSRGKVR